MKWNPLGLNYFWERDNFQGLLYSKQDELRIEATEAIRSVSRQCSDSSAIERLLVHLFGILSGSEGKLSTADQKMNVLQVNNALFWPVDSVGNW